MKEIIFLFIKDGFKFDYLLLIRFQINNCCCSSLLKLKGILFIKKHNIPLFMIITKVCLQLIYFIFKIAFLLKLTHKANICFTYLTKTMTLR